MSFNYYYKKEAEKYSFIRIPKVMMTEELFASLSIQAKILYGLLLDRLGEASKNKWVDERFLRLANTAKKNRTYALTAEFESLLAD